MGSLKTHDQTSISLRAVFRQFSWLIILTLSVIVFLLWYCMRLSMIGIWLTLLHGVHGPFDPAWYWPGYWQYDPLVFGVTVMGIWGSWKTQGKERGA